jgi:tetratricopeptide (TPR) repeat protein
VAKINWGFLAKMHDFSGLVLVLVVLYGCEPQFGKDRIITDLDTASPAASERYLRSTIDQHPEVIENYVILGRLFLRENREIQAKRILETAYGRRPDHPQVIDLLSEQYLGSGELQEAMAVLKRAEKSGIHSFGIYRNFARLYYKIGDYDLMSQYVNRAVQYDPDDWEMLFLKGEIARNDNTPESAFDLYERVYSMHPSELVFNTMYDYAVTLNDMDRITKYVEQGFVRHPVSSGLFLRVGSHFKTRGMEDTTMVLYRRAIELDPSNIAGYISLGDVFLNKGRPDSAQSYAQRALSIDARSADGLLLSARAYDRAYNYTAALEVYQQVVELEPGNEIARKELTILNGKIAYLRDMKRIQEQKKNLRVIKVPQSKKMQR